MKMSMQEEQSLVSAVRSGDRAAFGRLVRAYERLVMHIAGPLAGNVHDCDDICQEVFIKVYRQLHRFEGRSRLASWIGQIAYNTAVNFLRKRKSLLLDDLFHEKEDDDEGPLTGIPPADVDERPDQQLMRKDAAARLYQLAERLPPLQKTVLRLFHTDDLSLEEIAGILTMPVNTVKSHLYRARKNLKQALLKQRFL